MPFSHALPPPMLLPAPPPPAAAALTLLPRPRLRPPTYHHAIFVAPPFIEGRALLARWHVSGRDIEAVARPAKIIYDDDAGH